MLQLIVSLLSDSCKLPSTKSRKFEMERAGKRPNLFTSSPVYVCIYIYMDIYT